MAEFKFTVLDVEDEGDVEVSVPTSYEVCPHCEGSGTMVNPAVDGNGLTAEDFADDPDFEEAYFAGRYDIPCDTCHGLRVVPRPDEDKMTPEQRRYYALYRGQEEDRAKFAAEMAWERRMGC